ncbi:MAG TPA: protein translocase subunit SecF [Ruminococcus sp.]
MSKKNTQKSALENVKAYNFCGKKKMILGISIGVLIALILGIIIRGVNFAIEFKGGTMLTYSYSGDIDANSVTAVVKENVNTNINVRMGEDVNTGGKQFMISFTSEDGFNADKQAALTEALKSKFASNEIRDTESNDVNPSTGREFFIKCIVAILFAALLVIIYIAVRFRKIGGWSAGFCSILALCHDLVVALAVSILFGFEFNSNTVAVILTILGYSINNTIVIYDRIREDRTLMAKASLNDVINMGCTQSLTRSIRTSITTIFTMLVITVVALVQGYDSLLTFSVPLMAGLISGTYTSLFVAPVTWSWWKNKSKVKKTAK